MVQYLEYFAELFAQKELHIEKLRFGFFHKSLVGETSVFPQETSVFPWVALHLPLLMMNCQRHSQPVGLHHGISLHMQ